MATLERRRPGETRPWPGILERLGPRIALPHDGAAAAEPAVAHHVAVPRQPAGSAAALVGRRSTLAYRPAVAPAASCFHQRLLFGHGVSATASFFQAGDVRRGGAQ